MGNSPVVATGVMRADGEEFLVDYEVWEFKPESGVYCRFCYPQPNQDSPFIGDGTLSCDFNPADVVPRAPISDQNPYGNTRITSSDAWPDDGVFQFIGTTLKDTAHPDAMWKYQMNALFHLVLPPYYLPLLDSIDPRPRYGWRIQDRFVIGWRGTLSGMIFLFKFREVAPERFHEEAREVRHAIARLEVAGTNPPEEHAHPLYVPHKQEPCPDFELHITPEGHAIANSPQGEATANISTVISDSIQSALHRIERGQADTVLLKQVGAELYNWLFPSPIHTHFVRTQAIAQHDDTRLRVRLRIEPDSIARLPLELAYYDEGGYRLAVHPRIVLSRYLNVPIPPKRRHRQAGEPLQILALIADPNDNVPFNPEEWEQLLQDTLKDPIRNGRIRLHTIKQATRSAIRSALLAQKPNIVQFIGHGMYRDNRGYLALVEEGTGSSWLVDDERFTDLFSEFADQPGLVSLITCESARSNSPQGFVGIAPRLIQSGIPAVIAMQHQISIETARVFLKTFYVSIADDKPIDWATQLGRNAIWQEYGEHSSEFATPVLYMRAQDGWVF